MTGIPLMEAFHTIQGEGFHQGKAAYFIRLAGCDVGCHWCDVKESWDMDAHPRVAIDRGPSPVSGHGNGCLSDLVESLDPVP